MRRHTTLLSLSCKSYTLRRTYKLVGWNADFAAAGIDRTKQAGWTRLVEARLIKVADLCCSIVAKPATLAGLVAEAIRAVAARQAIANPAQWITANKVRSRTNPRRTLVAGPRAVCPGTRTFTSRPSREVFVAELVTSAVSLWGCKGSSGYGGQHTPNEGAAHPPKRLAARYGAARQPLGQLVQGELYSSLWESLV